MVNKNKNHDAGCEMRDAGCESVRNPMFPVWNAECGEGGARVQSLRFKVQSGESEVEGGAKFAERRLKLKFFKTFK